MFRVSRTAAAISAASLVAAPAFEGSALASSSREAQSRLSAERVAYCMKQVLQKPEQIELGLSAPRKNKITGVVASYFEAGIHIGEVPDKEGRHCSDVAIRSAEPLLFINGQEVRIHAIIGGNSESGKAEIQQQIVGSFCLNGSSTATAEAQITATPRFGHVAPATVDYRFPNSIKTTCVSTTPSVPTTTIV